jgi:hypothetical protein
MDLYGHLGTAYVQKLGAANRRGLDCVCVWVQAFQAAGFSICISFVNTNGLTDPFRFRRHNCTGQDTKRQKNKERGSDGRLRKGEGEKERKDRRKRERRRRGGRGCREEKEAEERNNRRRSRERRRGGKGCRKERRRKVRWRGGDEERTSKRRTRKNRRRIRGK